MIPFEELSAALDRWRIRNGLPVVTADLPIVPDSARPATTPGPFVMPAAAAATQPRTAPPQAAPRRPPTDSDVFAIGDADVVEDDEIYQNEGGDFAMSFGGSSGVVAGSIGSSPGPEDHPRAGRPAHAKAPAQIYDEGDDAFEASDDQATYVPNDVAQYQDPAYDSPQPLEAIEPDLPPLPGDEEEEEDWSQMPNFPGNAPGPDTMDAGDDVVDERPVGDDRDRKR